MATALRTLAIVTKASPGWRSPFHRRQRDGPRDGLPDRPVAARVSGRHGTTIPCRTSRSNASREQTAFEDAPVTLQAEVTATGYSGERWWPNSSNWGTHGTFFQQTAFRRDQRGSAAKTSPATSVARRPGGGQSRLEQQKRPGAARIPRHSVSNSNRTGRLSFYRLQSRPRKDWIADNAALSTEATLANNSRVVVVDRGRGPYRILYVSGRPNWNTIPPARGGRGRPGALVG